MRIMSAAPPTLPSVYDPSRPIVTNLSGSSSSTNLSPWIIIMTLLVLSVIFCLLFRNCHGLPYFLSRRGSNLHSLNPPACDDDVIKSLIDSLPLFTFSSVTRRSNATATSSFAIIEADCAVCLSRFVSHDTLRLLPLCCHAFHSRCIDTWLSSGQKTCPLCRSDVYASAALILLPPASSGSRNGSFRLEISSVSRRRNDSTSNGRRSYSIGSFDYVAEAETEVIIFDMSDGVNNNPVDVGDLNSDHSRSWLVECNMNRLSSRTASFRTSRRFFTGSSRRSEVAGISKWDVEAGCVVEEISELFHWASVV